LNLLELILMNNMKYLTILNISLYGLI
jgi:hypothetical protein